LVHLNWFLYTRFGPGQIGDFPESWGTEAKPPNSFQTLGPFLKGFFQFNFLGLLFHLGPSQKIPFREPFGTLQNIFPPGNINPNLGKFFGPPPKEKAFRKPPKGGY